MRTSARYAEIARDAGHYESFYVKATKPGGGEGVWIRHTVHKRPGAEPTGSVWFTHFNGQADGPRAAKVTVGADELRVPDGHYVEVDGARIGPEGLAGSIAAGGLEASWDLRISDRHEPLRHLPYERLYNASIPRTKLLSPHPGATYDGELTIDGETIQVEGWPGMVGHNWGAEHAERWIWLHAAGFEGHAEGDYFDIGAGRIKLGPVSTPWVANGMLVLDGVAHRLGGLGSIYGTHIDETPTDCEFTIPGKKINVRGRVSAPAKDFVGWVYADPDGPEHNTVNCSIADMELRIERPGKPHAHLRVSGAAAYELGMRETDHGIPIQPFGDG